MFNYLVAFTVIGLIIGFTADHCIQNMDYCPLKLEAATALNKHSTLIYVLTAIGGGLIAMFDILFNFQYHIIPVDWNTIQSENQIEFIKIRFDSLVAIVGIYIA